MLVVVVLASSLAALLGSAAAAPTTYALNGFVAQPGGLNAPPVPAGVTVDLTSRATGELFTTTTSGRGGAFAFTSAGTGSLLQPGFWGLSVPAVGNVSLPCGARFCAVLPQAETPTYRYYNSTVLTNSSYTQTLANVSVVPYNVTLNGNVTQGGSPVQGATVQLLAPQYNGLVLSANVSNATGHYNLTVPWGTWVLQFSHTSGSDLFTNSTLLKVTAPTALHINPVLRAYAVSGRIFSSVTKSYITTEGNATLFDPSNHYVYTTPTPTGGYYSFASYPANFSHGAQAFDVVVAPVGFEPAWYSFSSNATPSPYTRSVTVAPGTAGALGGVTTVLNFTSVNTTTGKGTLNVSTSARLGNDSVLPQLPNASVGQLWAQLGLDFNRSLSFPSADVGTTLKSWIGAQGPFFPAVQASTTVNGTGFVAPATGSGLASYSSTCSSGSCGLASAASLSYGWAETYTLNGTLAKDASSYVISFQFAHPASSTLVYNYTLLLPKGYALYADTTAPAQTTLLGKGPEGSWTNFTLQSKESSTSAATATFTIVHQTSFTANVAISSTNFTFSNENILNSTHENYTAVLGVGENATYSAAPSVYPAGVNGTLFEWYFGLAHGYANTTNETTNYTYHAVGTYHGKLTVLSSTGQKNNTTFNVTVSSTVPKVNITSNATANQTKRVANTNFLIVNWTTTLQFNATPSLYTSVDNLSVAHYTLSAHSYSSTANFSASAGANPFGNWSVEFGANTTNSTTAPGRGLYLNLSNVKINGTYASTVGVKGFGWVYNLTLQVWSLVGTNATAHLTILVNDTEPPVPSITLRNSVGNVFTNSITEAANHTAAVRFDATGTTDYGNGSVVKYVWFVSNPGNSSFLNKTINATGIKPHGQYPTIYLAPRLTDYKVKLTVTDKNGNKANTTVSFEVAENTTTRPIMATANLTGPTTLNAGTSYTYWVNVTVSGGTKSVAKDVTVSFYLLPPSGTGTKQYIAGTPDSVVFYGYSNTSVYAKVNATSLGTGSVLSLKYGLTVRAVISWTPSKSGSFILYAYASATNQFVNNSSTNTASTAITVNPNPTTRLLEYGGVAAGLIIVVALLVLLWRRRTRVRKPGTPSKPSSQSRSGLERGGRSSDDDDE